MEFKRTEVRVEGPSRLFGNDGPLNKFFIGTKGKEARKVWESSADKYNRDHPHYRIDSYIHILWFRFLKKRTYYIWHHLDVPGVNAFLTKRIPAATTKWYGETHYRYIPI